jgi:hypothetical protein
MLGDSYWIVGMWCWFTYLCSPKDLESMLLYDRDP